MAELPKLGRYLEANMCMRGIKCLALFQAISLRLSESMSCVLQEARAEEAEKAFAKALELDTRGQRSSQMLRLHAHMCQGLGRHDRAVRLLRDALEASKSPGSSIECLQLKGMQCTQLTSALHDGDSFKTSVHAS